MGSTECWVGMSLQPWGGYLGRALVFVWDSALGGGPVSISQKFLALRSPPSGFKLFGNSWANLYISCLLLIITLCFTCRETCGETLVKFQKVSKYYVHDILQNFLLLFMSLLTASVFSNIQILAGIYFIFLKKTS